MKEYWNRLSPVQRGLLVGATAVDLTLRVVAVTDAVRRPAAQINGPKPIWIAGLAVVNSVGILPTIYLVRGRKQA